MTVGTSTGTEREAAWQVDVLLFQIGAEVYGVDAAQVLRIERSGVDALTLDALGLLDKGMRALVFKTEEGEGRLKVDAVLGVKSASVQALRQLPPTASQHAYTIGLWLADERPVLLLDLVETLKSQGRE